MADFLKRACEERGGCANAALPGKRKCAQHDDSRARDNRRRREDPTGRFYNSAAWRRTSEMLRRFNPICQKLTDGEACRNPAALVHHMIGPMARPDLMFAIFDPITKKSHLVCLCKDHHPDTDTPEWTEGKDFSRTEYRCAMLGE